MKRLDAIPEVYKRQQHIGSGAQQTIQDVGFNTYENVDNLARGILAPNGEVNVRERKNFIDASLTATLDTMRAAFGTVFGKERGKNLGRTAGGAFFGIPGGIIKDFKDLFLRKDNQHSIIVQDA